MFNWASRGRADVAAVAVLTVLSAPMPAPAQERYPGIGRTATASELRAWDIDVRPDFKGLPPGRGTVAQGQVLWEARCAGCHGTFGESGEFFMPLVGGSTARDAASGRVARLADPSFPARTAMMKLATVSTLWDYIHRAMPWTAPKSLTHDEVYAATAYLLYLGEVLPADFELSQANIAQVQQRLPNRLGMTTAHALWPGREFGGAAEPDVQGNSCMTNCGAAPTIASSLPDYARPAHGNLAQQQRSVGAQRGAVTVAVAAPDAAAVGAAGVKPLLDRHACLACHRTSGPLVGPGWRDVAARHAGRGDATAYLAGKIRQGGQGAWGTASMPAQGLSEVEAMAVAAWLAAGAPE